MLRRFTAVLLALAAAPTALAASVPVVVLGPADSAGEKFEMTSAYLLGGWKDGLWQDAPKVKTPWPTRWQMLTLGQPTRQVTLSQPSSGGEGPCSDIQFSKVQTTVRDARPGISHVLVPAGVKAQPRPVTVFPNSSSVYRDVVTAELKKLGLGNVPVRINSILQVDLDGNGTKEVLIEASNVNRPQRFRPDGPTDKGGQYSLVLLRFVKGGKVYTSTLAKDVQVRAMTPAEVEQQGGKVLNRYGIAGVLDVNGDGRMEVVLASAYYEGDWMQVLEFTPSWSASTVAETGCGA